MPNLDSLIEQFFLINDQPSDDQIHKLSYALGIDKETVEATIYRLYGAGSQTLESRLAASSEDELALQGEIPMDELNDRQATFNDGVLVDDAPTDQELLVNDGDIDLLVDPDYGVQVR